MMDRLHPVVTMGMVSRSRVVTGGMASMTVGMYRGGGLDGLGLCVSAAETSHEGWFRGAGDGCVVAAAAGSKCHFDYCDGS